MANKPSLEQVRSQLMVSGFGSPAPHMITTLADPATVMPMTIKLEQLRPYDNNPRINRNPKYDEIKESIRARGLDHPPAITRRPGEEFFIIRDGGNTRLAVLNELWTETKEERFHTLHVLFRPWESEINALTGHLAENDTRGDLSFIERALGIEKARSYYEQETGEPLSQRELARRLKANGYPISNSHISRMQDAIKYLLPTIPQLLYAGLGVDQATRLISLRKSAQAVWEKHQSFDLIHDFDTVFLETLSLFDDPTEPLKHQRVLDELIGQMSDALGIEYNLLSLDLQEETTQARRTGLVSSASFDVIDHPDTTLHQEQATVTQDANQPEPVQSQHQNSKQQLKVQQEPSPISSATSSVTNGNLTDSQKSADPEHPDPQLSSVATSDHVRTAKHVVDEEETIDEVSHDDQECAVHAIPVSIQANGLYPVSDIWLIDEAIDNPALLRAHIAQLVREIAVSVGLPDHVEAISCGIGFHYARPWDDPLAELSASAFSTLMLIESLSGVYALASTSLSREQTDGLMEFHFSAHLGRLLMGSPADVMDADASSSENRLSDTAVIKLFRVIRLARRLIDLTRTAHI